MFWFGLFQRQAIAAKQIIYSLLTHSLLEQIRDIFTKAQLEVNNSMHYPQLEMTSQEESRLYRALMSFNSGYNDFLSGPLIDRANFRNLFGMIYFDLRNQEEDVKDSVVSLTFRYELNGGNPTAYTLNALVLHEREIELYTASGKLLIKA